MSRSIGRDLRTRGKFRITGYDEERGCILVCHARDGWINRDEEAEAIHWTRFVEDLRDGHYELIPHSDPLTTPR